MKKHIIQTTLVLGLATTLFTGCGGGSSSERASQEISFTSGTILYKDGSTFGVTREEAQEDGAFKIYDIGSGAHVGNIRIDAQVTDVNGNALGICSGATITENGISGECSLQGDNPEVRDPDPDAPKDPVPIKVSVNITYEGPVYDKDNVPLFPNLVTNGTGKVTYKWSIIGKPSGSSPELSPTNASVPNLRIDIPGTYTVKLVATVDGVSATDTVSITAVKL